MDNGEYVALHKRRTKLGQELAVAEHTEQEEQARLRGLLQDAKLTYGTTSMKELQAKLAELTAQRDASLAEAAAILDLLEASS